MSKLSITSVFLSQQYRYQDQSKKAICAAIGQYRNLNPGHEMYHFPNGVVSELVALSGTVPVSYKGSMYNIPVAIYIPNDYPYSPPICYVKPTADMMIKQGRHVDASGRVYLPYLSDWKNDGSSDLLGVIQVMIIVFGESPPVYQRPKTAVAADNCPYPRQREFSFQYACFMFVTLFFNVQPILSNLLHAKNLAGYISSTAYAQHPINQQSTSKH